MKHLVLAALLLLAPLVAAQADDDAPPTLSLPGLQADASRFRVELRKPYPAGAPAAVLRNALAAANKAIAAGDWAGALPPLRVLAGGAPKGEQPNYGVWYNLAQAALRVTPPVPDQALDAGWLAYTTVDDGATTAARDKTDALRLMDQALVLKKQQKSDILVLQAIVALQPTDASAKATLASRRKEYGLLYDSLDTDSEAFPARACIGFFGNPSSAPDFQPGDWVTLSPARPDTAVTLEDRHICVAGLPPGQTTTLTFRHGMPGEDGLTLKDDLVLPVAMPDRVARLVFNNARYLQPRGAAATVALDVVNLSRVKLTLVRIAERNLLHVMQTYPPGKTALDSGAADDLTQNQGRVVWTGSAAVTDYAANAVEHVVLPLPPTLAAPGLYALIAAPGDGSPFGDGGAPSAVQMILRSDLAPTVWHGSDGDLVQVRSYATGLPVSGAAIDLVAADNEILGNATTDAEGTARFAAPLLAGQNGLAPAALHIRAAEDFTRLGLTSPDFDLSDRGVAGNAPPGPLDPFLWTDRGIYRPGETIHVTGLLRDAAGAPSDLPLHLIVTRPDGRVFSDTVQKPANGDSIRADVALSPGAQFGDWGIALATDPTAPMLTQIDVKVAAFVPPRLAVAFGALPPLVPGRSAAVPVDVRFLYGAPGAALSASGSMTLTPNPVPFAAFRDYRFGLADDRFTSSRSDIDVADTDAQGHTSLPVNLAALPDTSVPLQAALAVDVNDPAGRSVQASAAAPIRPAAPLIGIAEDFADGTVNAGSEARFRLAAVDPDGKRAAMAVQLRLVRQLPDWRLAVRDGQARYEIVWRDEPVDSRTVTLAANGDPFVYAKTLPFGRYRLMALQQGGMAASSVVFFSGWAVGDDPDVPARVSVRADRGRYAPGDTATIHVEAPFAGPATILVMTDTVKRLIDLPASGPAFDVKVPVDAGWGPGAYVAAHVYRPGDSVADKAPDRAIGLTWVGLDPAPRTLALAIADPGTLRPRTRATIAVTAAPSAWVTLAAVDEGVLGLTHFTTPDPLAHYFGQRRLGVAIHDDFARLLAPAGAANTVLREGAGGDNGGGAVTIPQQVVALFVGPVQAGADGRALIPLDLPDFNGQLRLMAVGWEGSRVGSAASDVTVRDQLLVEALLPRFLAPGDHADAGIEINNLELPAGAVSLHLAASGALKLTAADPPPQQLAQQQRVTVPLGLDAVGAGEGTLRVAADGPGGFHVEHSATLTIRPARPAVTVVTPVTLAAGESRTLSANAGAFIPGSWTATASFGGGVRYDPTAMVRALEAYPLTCLEQLTSRGLPLAMLRGEEAGPDRAGQLQLAMQAVLDRQRFDGGFGLWSAAGEAEPWLSAYATDFLLRARAAGAPVPPTAIDGALTWLAGETATAPTEPDAKAAQAYALYVLALAGRAPAGAIRLAAAGDEPTPLARAQLAGALARLGDGDAARRRFQAVLADPLRKDWSADYGSALRDQLATAVLVQESGVDAGALPAVRAALPGADLDPDRLNTQEQAWAGAAAGALTGPPVSLTVDGRPRGPAPSLTIPALQAVQIGNPGPATLAGSLAVTGVPVAAPPAARNGMEVHRHFFATDGSAIDPDKLPRNTVFVLLIDGRANDGQDHRAMLLAGLPAGWEIAGQFAGGEVAGMDWLGKLSEADSQSAGDDRYAAALSLTGDAPDFRVAVMLRAVTPGTYEYPGITLSDMYRPAIMARQGTVRISVLPAP